MSQLNDTTPLVPMPLLEQASRRFKLLGDVSRLAILNLLHTHGELSVQALVDGTGQSQPNVSRHLGLMAREGMVERRREGMNVYYRISDPSLSGICLLICGQLRNE